MIQKVLLLVMFALSLIYSAITVKSAEVASMTQQLYGRYEVRMKTAQGEGIVNAFFTFENDGWMPSSGKPWREIDIEVLGRYTDRFQTNIITGNAEARVTSEFFPLVSANPAAAYHTYGIEWTPDYISFSFDGKEMRRTEYGDAKKQVEDCRAIPQSYRFNFWANAITDWVGTFDPSSLPKYQFVNWIKYYSYSLSSKTFTLSWTDDFDSLSNSRWSKATHTIENFTQFATANAFVKDGALVLAMTDLQGNGLTNVTVPADSGTKVVTRKADAGKVALNFVKSREGLVVCLVKTAIAEKVVLELLDLNGKVIDSKVEFVSSGSHELVLHGTTGGHVARGVYIVKLKVDGTTLSQKVSLVD